MKDLDNLDKSQDLPGGLFVVLYDNDTLDLYLKEGVYGFLMPPVFGRPASQSKHYAVLSDYACTRQGTHVFFFLKRTIVYAGQIIGNRDIGAFYLNGGTSPLGREANANLYWDESARYEPTEQAGVFKVHAPDGTVSQKAQPFLIRFQDALGLSRREINSDELYFELGSYPYPLPSNSIQGMGFCTLTPGETALAMQILTGSTRGNQPLLMKHRVARESSIVGFDSNLGIQKLQSAYEGGELVNESHLEFSIIANPLLLPRELRPTSSEVICRQVPISPFKPFNMDRADVCYYDTQNTIRNGTLPNRIIELKKEMGTVSAIQQVERYLRWIQKITLTDEFAKIDVFVFAPSFRSNALNYKSEFAGKIALANFSGEIHRL